jgi:hypothetical protein
MKKFLITLSLFFVFMSCEKDMTFPLEGDQECFDISYPKGTTILPYSFNEFGYYSPDYNPLNPNEICYIRIGHYPIYSNELRKRDLFTNEDILLATPCWERPNWTSNNWIFFNKGDNQLWKIKGNGDSLTQISQGSDGDFFSASWDDEGKRVAFRKRVTNGYLTILADANGFPIDTIENKTISISDWSGDTLIMDNYINGKVCFVLYNAINKTSKDIITSIENTGKGENVRGLVISRKGKKILWSNKFGLFETQIRTGKTRILRPLCPSKAVFVSSLTDKEHSLLAEKTLYKLNKDSTIKVTTLISSMDLDGRNELDLIKP